MLGRLKARLGYGVARKLFHQSWCVRQPRIWGWMEGQFARMSNLGDTGAQSFYGHILAFRGQGLGAREEGVRLLRLAAQGKKRDKRIKDKIKVKRKKNKGKKQKYKKKTK